MVYVLEKFWSRTDKLIYRIFKFKTAPGWLILGWVMAFFPAMLSAQSFTTVELEGISSFLDKVQAYRGGYTNYHVQFRENTGNNLLIGDLYYAKPEQLRITYYRGSKVVTEVFLGPEKLIVYFVDSAIVYEQENFNVYNTQSGSLIPGSLDYLIQSYNFNFVSKNPEAIFKGEDYRSFNLTRPPQDLAYHLRLTPKNVTEGLDNLEIWLLAEKIGGGQYRPTQVIRSRLRSRQGTTSDIYFSKVNVNEKFPVDIFNFVIPNHVRIVKNYLPTFEDIDLKESLERSE